MYAWLEAGEAPLKWVIQEQEQAPIAIPTWMSRVFEMVICQWLQEKEGWEAKIDKLALQGKTLPPSLVPKHNLFLSEGSKKYLVFDKKSEALVSDARRIPKSSIAVELLLSEDPEKLAIKTGNGVAYRLRLLKGQSLSTEVPPSLDVKPDKKKAAEAQPVLPQDMELSGEALDMELQHAEKGMAAEDVVEDVVEYMAGSDQESDGDMELLLKDGSSTAKKVKSFDHQPEYKRLEQLGLTWLPHHIQGCCLGYHKANQQWQGVYPDATKGMSYCWGGKTKRTPDQALLKAIRAVLEQHCAKNPLDKKAAKQLEKVKAANV